MNITQEPNISKIQPNQSVAALPVTNVQVIAELFPLASIIIIVNMVVFVLFLKTKTLRSPANYILFSLSISDFMTGALNIPLFVIVFYTPVISSLKVRFYWGFLVTVVHTVTAVLSVNHILVATLEKYLSIIWPVAHRLVEKAAVKRMLLVVWFVSTLIGFIPFTWINKTGDPSGTKYFLGYIIFCLVTVFALPYSFMMYAFVKIFRVLSKRLKMRSTHRNGRKRKAARERKCIVLFVTMATLFAVCWLPYFLLMLLYALDSIPISFDVPAHVIILIRYTTSVINPLLHTFLRPDFYAALKGMLKKFELSLSAICRSPHQRKDRGRAISACYIASNTTTPEQGSE